MPDTTSTIESDGRRRLLAHVTPPTTVTELAHKIGVSHAAVSQWLAGVTAPSRKNAAAIETLTGIPASAWIDDATRKVEKKRAKKEGRA